MFPWDLLSKYAKWRYDYLEENPDKRLFPWIFGGFKGIPAPSEPIITLGEKGKGLLVLGLVLVALFASSDSK